jgi:hypothetical protein
MTPKQVEKLMKESGEIKFVPYQTTFTADELINNFWTKLNYPSGSERFGKTPMDDDDYKTLGMLVDILYSKIQAERDIRFNKDLMESMIKEQFKPSKK